MMWLLAIVPTLGLFGYPNESTPGSYPSGDEAAAAIFTAHSHPARVSRYWYDADLYSLESLFERRCWGEHNGVDQQHSIETFDYETAVDRHVAPPARNLMDFMIPHLSADYPFIGFNSYPAAIYREEHPYGREYSFFDTNDYELAYCPFNGRVTRILLPPQVIYTGSTNNAPKGIKYANIYTRTMYPGSYYAPGGGLLELIDRGQWRSQFTGQSIYHHLSDPYLQDIDQDEFFWAGFFPRLNDGSQAYTTFSGVSGFQDSPNSLGDGAMLRSWWSWDNCDSGLCGIRWTTNAPVRASRSPVNSSFIIDKWWDVSALMGQYDATVVGQREHGKWRDTIAKRGGTNNYTGAAVDISTTNKRRRYFVNDAFGVAVTNDVNWYTPWASRILWHPRAVANELLDRLDWAYTSRQSYRPMFANEEYWGRVALEGDVVLPVSGVLKVGAEYDPWYQPLTLELTAVEYGDVERAKDENGNPIPLSTVGFTTLSNRTYMSEIADFSSRITAAQGRVLNVPRTAISNGVDHAIILGYYYPGSESIENTVILSSLPAGTYHGYLIFASTGVSDFNRTEFRWEVWDDYTQLLSGYADYYVAMNDLAVGFSNVVATVNLAQAIECIRADLLDIGYGFNPTNMVLQENGFPATYPAWQYADRKVERTKSNYMLAGWHGNGSLTEPSTNRSWVFSWDDTETVNQNDGNFMRGLNRDCWDCCDNLLDRFYDAHNKVDSPLSWNIWDYQQDDLDVGGWVDRFLRALFDEIAFTAQVGFYWEWFPWVEVEGMEDGGYIPSLDFEVTVTEETTPEGYVFRDASVVYFDPTGEHGQPLENNELKGRFVIGMRGVPGYVTITNGVEGASARCDLSGFSATHYNWTTQPVKKGQP